MTSDFNPSKYDQPDFAKEQVDSARFGLGVLLIFVFTIGRSVQMFSRKAGTAGPFMVLANLLCIILQAWYYQGCTSASGNQDFIEIDWLIAIQFAWFAYSIFSTFRFRKKGLEVAPTEMGQGILHRLMPDSDWRTTGIASDLTIALGLSGLLFVCNSPILGGWYGGMAVWLFLGHSWLSFRERMELKRIKFATDRAKHISQRFRKRNR